MDDHSSSLVDDENVRILEHDVEWDVFAGDLATNWRRDVDRDSLALTAR
jgi:hypothetical protein